MRFKGLDLNLLVALNVLLEEMSVSKAARRLNLSQPAMSAALGRLRDYFGDPLLQPSGKNMVPTAHARQIEARIQSVLRELDFVVSQSTRHDPASSDRRFVIAASDYVGAVLLAGLIPQLKTVSPHIQLDIIPPGDLIAAMLDQGRLDCAILPEPNLSEEHPRELLFEDRFVVVGCQTNRALARGLTEDEFYDASHVMVKMGSTRPTSVAEGFLEARGRPRRVELQLSSFLLAPEMVVNTDRLTVMHARLAKKFETRLPIRSAEVPFDFPPMREFVQYNAARTEDAGLRWLIDQFRRQVSINDADAVRSNQSI